MNKTTISLIVVAIIAVVAYFYINGTPSSDSLLVSQSSASGVGSQELSLLQQIRSLRIDSSLFSDPAYRTLIDYSVPIPSLPVGRANPFAPLPGVSSDLSH